MICSCQTATTTVSSTCTPQYMSTTGRGFVYLHTAVRLHDSALCQHFTATQKLTQLERLTVGGVPYQQVECQLLTQMKASYFSKSSPVTRILNPFCHPHKASRCLPLPGNVKYKGYTVTYNHTLIPVARARL